MSLCVCGHHDEMHFAGVKEGHALTDFACCRGGCSCPGYQPAEARTSAATVPNAEPWADELERRIEWQHDAKKQDETNIHIRTGILPRGYDGRVILSLEEADEIVALLRATPTRAPVDETVIEAAIEAATIELYAPRLLFFDEIKAILRSHFGARGSV